MSTITIGGPVTLSSSGDIVIPGSPQQSPTLEEITQLFGNSLIPQGGWDASANTPTLPGDAETGQFWIISVDGTTGLDGITDWKVNDWAVKTATGWAKVDNTDKVVTVNSVSPDSAGNVSIAISDIPTLQTVLDGKEPVFTKNTAFNKDFGTESGQVTEGDDSRLQHLTSSGNLDNPSGTFYLQESGGGPIQAGDEVWIFKDGESPRILVGDSGSEYGYLGWDSTNNYFRVETNGANGIKVNGNNVAIGNIFPSSTLLVASGTTKLFEITSSGYVGIGSITPTHALDVEGQVRLRYGAGDGYFLSSDATGVITPTVPNTAFNKDFGTGSGQVTEGNDSRLQNLTSSGNIDDVGGDLYINESAGGHITCFSGADEGDTKQLQIFGHRTGDSLKRYTWIGISNSADNSAIWAGVNNYRIAGTLTLDTGVGISAFSSDGTLSGNSDTEVPTEKAVKTYVDDGDDKDLDGDWESKSFDTNYQATVGGFVVAKAEATGSARGHLVGYTDSSSTPSTARAHFAISAASPYINRGSLMMPVKKGDYYKVVVTNTVDTLSNTILYFLPFR